MLRAPRFIYGVAFLVAWNQSVPLIGEHGSMPFTLFLERAPDALSRYRFARSGSSYWTRERVRPWLPPIDRGNPSVGRFLEQTGMVRR